MFQWNSYRLFPPFFLNTRDTYVFEQVASIERFEPDIGDLQRGYAQWQDTAAFNVNAFENAFEEWLLFMDEREMLLCQLHYFHGWSLAQQGRTHSAVFRKKPFGKEALCQLPQYREILSKAWDAKEKGYREYPMDDTVFLQYQVWRQKILDCRCQALRCAGYLDWEKVTAAFGRLLG